MVRKKAACKKDSARPQGVATHQKWQLQDAKARFSEVFRLARHCGPQVVIKHGREAVVVITAEEYARLAHSKAHDGNLAEFFAASPLRGSGLDLERPGAYRREIELGTAFSSTRMSSPNCSNPTQTATLSAGSERLTNAFYS